MSRELGVHLQARGAYDADEIDHCHIKSLIDNNIVELPHMGDLLPGVGQPALDHRARIGAPSAAGIVAQTGGFIAVVFGSANVFGGFMVTDRMLQMFKRKKG